MKIISHKNMKYDYYSFLNQTINNPDIVGVSFDILMTSDEKIIIYTPNSNFSTTISALQSNTYKNLKITDVLPLDETLNQFVGTNKKIVINLLPIVSLQITDYSLQNIIRINEQYVRVVKNILDKYPALEFYVCSTNENLVYHIKRILTNYKNGFVLTNLNTTYQDVDFYIFTTNMLDEKIIRQQLTLNREIMIFILNAQDMDMILDWISSDNFSKNDKQILNEIYFINNYPQLFLRIFNIKSNQFN
ncbi:MAG: hypothetical protein IJO32_05970 [Bacilli bacterium]|nr:hypothetical protein [Bacilli bacterium]